MPTVCPDRIIQTVVRPESPNEWNIVDTDTVLDVPWMHVRRDRVLMHPHSQPVDYYIWEGPDISTVVPRTPEGDFVLCRQYRHAIGKSLLQFPAGHVNSGESPRAAAERELAEETGYAAQDLMALGTLAAYPTKYTGLHHLFLAVDVYQVAQPTPDASEPTAVEILSPEHILRIVGTPEFMVADSVAAVLLALQASRQGWGVSPKSRRGS